ncbi:MAG: 2-hydroxychromene-2-carboxylate isomerase [Alphaproteobacteria bacterium]
MSGTIDYYYSHVSPYSFLGHAQLKAVAERTGASVNYRPISVAEIFPKTGGVPVDKRPPERRAYRMVELKRWSAHLNIPMNFEPKHFPVSDKPALHLALAAARHGADIHALSGAIMKAAWQEERDISDWETLKDIANTLGLDGTALADEAQTPDIEALGLSNCEQALKSGCFGVPWFVVGGEPFWGQDRLDMLEQKLSA